MSLGSVKARNASLDANYGDTHAADWPSQIYMHLYVGDPTKGGSEITSAGGYAAASIANNSTNFPNAVNGQKTNGTAITFPTSTGAWSGNPTYWWFTDAASGLARPGAPTITNVGAAGTSTYTYEVTALNASGETLPSAPSATTTGNAVLSSTNYNTVSWTAVTGATSYNVYKLSGGVYYLLANVTGTSYNDQGAALGTQTAPITDTTMNLLDGGPLSAPIVVNKAQIAVSFLPGSIVIAAS